MMMHGLENVKRGRHIGTDILVHEPRCSTVTTVMVFISGIRPHDFCKFEFFNVFRDIPQTEKTVSTTR